MKEMRKEKFVYFILLIVITVLFLSLAPSPVWAEGFADYLYVKDIRIDRDGKGLVVFTSALSGSRPSCAASYPYSLSFDTNTEGGKGVYILVLTAKALNKTIFARGTNSCSIFSVVEDWQRGWLSD